MYTCLATDAVKLKARFEPYTSLISDYELAYALGTAAAFMGITAGIDVPSDYTQTDLAQVQKTVSEAAASYNPKDSFENNIILMINEYVLIGTKAPEIPELLKEGLAN